ncbi:YHYH protein [Ekhidna sp. MALMAid0563]|uniref:YHYH protein n=1 Tax=Ekhidna sp. MALMAid0563 TaxID=3143937 RepID=UPI0032DEA155
MKLINQLFTIIILIGLMGCSNSNTSPTPIDEDALLISESLFNSSSLESIELVTSTLEDGTSAYCFELTFSSNPVESGPFCPETINDVAGIGFYDGATNPGLRVFSADLLNDIEADGYNMVNDDGTVNINDFATTTTSSENSYCLAAAPNNNLKLVFTIPASPKLGSVNNEISEIELIGLSLDGIPINGDPPSAVNGPAMFGTGTSSQINFPSLDPCGGHHDPAGYYHWHFVPQVINQVLAAEGITEVSCTNMIQTSSVELIGFAKDGFPIYAYADEPTDLDDCGGRTSSTDEFPDGVYHYVASTTTAANVPKCLKGVAANRPFQFQ